MRLRADALSPAAAPPPARPAVAPAPAIAVVVVHYHTEELIAPAVAALGASLERAALEAEWLLIDNGSDAARRELLAAPPLRVLDPGANLGYAGGVNLGVRASRAPLVVALNADVLVLPGCLAALTAALRDGFWIAGPRFYWDARRRLLLPPAERRGRWDEALSALAGAGGRAAARARRRWRRHARRHWLASAPLPSHALSGALLAFRRAAWERVGPFDDGFRLYFEESDWLGRARRRGLAAAYVPAAEAVHLHGRSAAAEPRAGDWFEASARRFRERHLGRDFTRLLERLDVWSRRRARPPAAAARGAVELPRRVRYPLWVEVSPNAVGFPAAAERVAEPPALPWRLPADVAAGAPGELWFQVSDAAGAELDRGRLAAGEEREPAGS